MKQLINRSGYEVGGFHIHGWAMLHGLSYILLFKSHLNAQRLRPIITHKKLRKGKCSPKERK